MSVQRGLMLMDEEFQRADSLHQREDLRQKELEAQRQKFYQAMSETIKEDKGGEQYGLISSLVDKGIDEHGRLTKDIRDELCQFKEEELARLEESIKNARPATEDIFGIKRRFCSVCEQGCIGYEANQIVIPNGDISEFPTFCKNCKCPAYFHQICFDPARDVVFPSELVETIKNYNIQSKDINFNCVLLAFQVRLQDHYQQNVKELLNIIKEEGLEVLQLEMRELDVEEAIYLKHRMIGQTENEVTKMLDSKSHGKPNTIRQEGYQGSSVLTKHAAKDPYLLNLYADEKEQKLQKLQQTMMNQKSQQNVAQHIEGAVAKPSQLEDKQGLMAESINQRMPLTSTNVINRGKNSPGSIARTSNVDSQFYPDDYLQITGLNMRETVLPKQRDKTLKLKTFSKTKTQVKSTLLRGVPPEATQEVTLLKQIDSNPLLKELVTKPLLLMAISSTTFQNLQEKLKQQIMTKIQHFLPVHELPLLYVSENKILALEDMLTFFPSLFRLNKSIIVSEPLFEQQVGLDQVSKTQMLLKSDDLSAKKLNEKLTLMMKEIDDNESMMVGADPELKDETEDNFVKNRKTLTRKVSSRVKAMIKKRDSLIGRSSNDNEEASIASWAERAKNREKEVKKQQKLLSKKNKNLYNFGVMLDFFGYSAFSVQVSVKDVDFTVQQVASKSSAFDSLRKDMSQTQVMSNVFAIAKVGLSNLLFPSQLDVKLSNYQNYPSYIRLSDAFCPQMSHSEHSVLLLRPIIVKNGLNDIFIQILKLNDFTVLKRKIRTLTKSEVVYLSELEAVTKDKAEAYYNLMMDGDCEIVVVSKFGAVEDLKALASGCKPYGRMRIPQLYEDQSNIRANVDSINSMFEISPFSSFSELIDLEDFIVSHSRLEKYKKMQRAEGKDQNSTSRIGEQLYFQKLESIRKELNLFQRFFNMVAFTPATKYEAQQEMCVLMPEVASIEEVILILNPIYNTFIEAAAALLKRMGFSTIKQKLMQLSYEDAELLMKERLPSSYVSKSEFGRKQSFATMQGSEKLVEYLGETQVYVWHLFKIGGDREVRQLYKDSLIEYDDLFSVKISQTPFKASHFPYLFLFMDTPSMFEQAMQLVWTERHVQVTGGDFLDGLSSKDKLEVLETALQVTLGDKIKHLAYDRQGNIVKGDLQYGSVNRVPQVFQLISNPKGNHAVHYLVESETHGLYEIRYQRLPQRGDYYSQANDKSKVDLKQLKLRYFARFQSLNYYYNEVNKRFYNICPAFYRFKIAPMVIEGPGSEQLNRVYEVEEYMGKLFIEDVANMHQDHLRMLKQQQQNRIIGWQQLTEDQQRSLPPYIWGLRLARVCKDLETIKGDQSLVGVGRVKFDKGQLSGEVAKPQDYYEFDKKRFMKYLDTFKQGWDYYLSVLESDLVEQKLLHILNSVTYKQSRSPSFMALVPERVTESNLRISEKIKFVVPEGLMNTNKEKFFTHLKEDLLSAHQEQETVSNVQSILHTLHVANIKRTVDTKQISGEKQKFSVHKDCGIVGVEVAKRPKYHLLASVLYLFNFWYRKVERRANLFEDIEKQFVETKQTQDPEKDFDMVLDIIVRSIQDNYGDDEFNLALDMASLLPYDDATEFERLIKERQEQETKLKAKLQQRVYEQQRLMRTQMTIEKLIETQCTVPAREYEMRQRDMLRKFTEARGKNDHQGDGFLGVLKQTQSYLGPYSIKLAHEYLGRFEREEKSRQERISFVKMEYFLFGVSEAYRTIQELKLMESRINALQDEVDIRKKDFVIEERQILRYATQSSFGPDGVTSSPVKAKVSSKAKKLQELEDTLEKLRYQISTKETELVLQFRELIAWDYMVPDHYFDVQKLMQKKALQANVDTYTIPFKNFWRPVYFEGYYEPDLTGEKFALRIRDYERETNKKGPSLYHENPKKDQGRVKGGTLISYLRPYDNKQPNDYLKFDKYYSLGEWKQHQEIKDIKELVEVKTSKITTSAFGQHFNL